MAKQNARAPSPALNGEPLSKKLKTGPAVDTLDPTPHFAAGLLDQNNAQKLHSEYSESGPYKYAIVERLFEDNLLLNVKDECLNQLSFTEKETDIYKVNQTGDLASLSYLSPEQLALLPSLLTLRDALYSPQFRAFVRTVTGCGPISGRQQDMSVNTYRQGCHLLNHDDVIGTRRVSYILYMPLPHNQTWLKEWGGGLELYPTKPGANGVLEPESVPSKNIPPSWNQFIFFEVQPGKSFHSVEEVTVDGGDTGERQRLSISGWFHAAHPDEEGYVPEPAPESKSSREQLASNSTVFTPYPDTSELPLPSQKLSEEHMSFLSNYLNPVYLQMRTIKQLAERFVEESSLEFHSFLSDPLAARLAAGLKDADTKDGLGGADRQGRIPPHTAGVDGAWAILGPPHKWRYCTLARKPDDAPAASSAELLLDSTPVADVLRCLQEDLFPSVAFRAWLAVVSQMLPLGYTAEARRFRPGLDYTLATSDEKEARLDVVLGLTPEVQPPKKGKGKKKQREPFGWETGQWGGWECYMAPHDEEDDPAVYRSSKSKKVPEKESEKDSEAETSNQRESPNAEEENGAIIDEDEEMSGSEDDDDEGEDDTLLTVQPGFNRLLMVLRDERVLKFVKYVSAAADGSRWDICGEYEVGNVEETSEGDDEEETGE